MAGWLWKDRPVFIKKGNKSEIYKEKEINNKSKTKKGGIRTLKLVFIPSFVNSLNTTMWCYFKYIKLNSTC